MNIDAYRSLHKALKLFERDDIGSHDKALCQYLRSDLEQSVHSQVSLRDRASQGFYCPSLAIDYELATLLGNSLDEGKSPFFLTFEREKVFRFVAEILPELGVCGKDWQKQPIRFAYWEPILTECRRITRIAEPGNEGVSTIFSLLETFRESRSITFRNNSSLASDMEEYLCVHTKRTPAVRELCNEIAQLLQHPEDLVLQAVASPIGWIRHIAMEALQMGRGQRYV